MKRTLLMTLMLCGVFFAKAQDEEGYTDEELKTYATVMVWAENEKVLLSNLVSDSVAIWLEDKELTNTKYNELSKADKKEELESVEASETELAAYTEIKDRIAAKTEKFKELYVTKIKEDIGAGLYNRLRKSLKSDEEVKARYEAIVTSLKEAEKAEETDQEPGNPGTAGSEE